MSDGEESSGTGDACGVRSVDPGSLDDDVESVKQRLKERRLETEEQRTEKRTRRRQNAHRTKKRESARDSDKKQTAQETGATLAPAIAKSGALTSGSMADTAAVLRRRKEELQEQMTLAQENAALVAENARLSAMMRIQQQTLAQVGYAAMLPPVAMPPFGMPPPYGVWSPPDPWGMKAALSPPSPAAWGQLPGRPPGLTGHFPPDVDQNDSCAPFSVRQTTSGKSTSSRKSRKSVERRVKFEGGKIGKASFSTIVSMQSMQSSMQSVPSDMSTKSAASSASAALIKRGGLKRDGGVAVCAKSDGESDGELDESEFTTIMMRNIPVQYSRAMLLETMDKAGFRAHCDLVYLPIDFKNKVGRGYCFINFTTHDSAERFQEHFEGFACWSVESDKVCSISWSDVMQGIAANVECYKNSPMMHESVPDEYKPALFKDGRRIDFPPPTMRIRPPRARGNDRNYKEDDSSAAPCLADQEKENEQAECVPTAA